MCDENPLRKAEKIFETLKKKLASLPERAMRREVFGEKFVPLEPEIQVELLNLIAENSPFCHKSRRLLVAFQDREEANHSLSYEQLKQIYAIAKERGYEKVRALLLSDGSSLAGREPGDLIPPNLASIPLGMRKFMARKPTIGVIEKLLVDPEPSVIRNLLLNPRLTEREVLRICSKRPNRPEVLREVARVSKWFNRYSVKLSIAKNPYSPTDLVLKILNFLKDNHLRELAEQKNLHPQIGKSAREIIEARRKKDK